MEQVQSDHVVEIDYILTDDKGTVIDSTQESNPIAFIQGQHHIVPGLEMEVQGKQVGDEFTVTLSPENAYGPYRESLIQVLPIEEFGSDAHLLTVGQYIQIQNYNGEVMPVLVSKITDQDVTLDANHALAGKTLNFEVKIVSMRDATPEELAPGYVAQESSCCSNSGCC